MKNDITIDLTANGKVVDQYDFMFTGEFDDDGNPCAAALIFDGASRGMWVNNAVVELARQYGWTGENSAEDIEASKDVDGDPLLIDTATRAEDYLNELVPDGYSFGWDDGSFLLANDAWWSLASQ